VSRIKGYACCGVPMVVTTTRHPAPGVVVRYRRCLLCGGRVVTEERAKKIPTNRKPPAES